MKSLVLVRLVCCLLASSAERPLQPQNLDPVCAFDVNGDGCVADLTPTDSVEEIGVSDHDPGEGEESEDDFLSNIELLSNMDPYTTAELASALSNYYAASDGITSNMQHHVEREFVARASRVDGGLASFGSLLDISTKSSATWSGSTDFGGKIPWIASLLHRQALVEGGEGQAVCEDADRESCVAGATADRYVSVRGTEGVREDEMMLAAEFSILDRGEFHVGHIMNLDCSDLKFDTVVANGALAAVDVETDPDALPMEDMDLVLEKLISCINPEGGTLVLVGIEEPQESVEPPAAGADVPAEITRIYDSVKSLFGEHKKGVSTRWTERTLSRFGLDVYSSRLFPVYYEYEDMTRTVTEVKEWIRELELSSEKPNAGIKKHYRRLVDELKEKLTEEPVFAGEHTYVIVAELPKE